MWKSVKIASAFVGVIVGAGFAAGQEILKYFTSFGYLGIIGVFVSTALFSYLGMNLTVIGSRLQTTSHKEAIYKICGKWLGFVVDAILVFTLFGVDRKSTRLNSSHVAISSAVFSLNTTSAPAQRRRTR